MTDEEATPTPLLNTSVIGRLLEELSWSGRSIRAYRDGGIGHENVLVAETLIALDFLPRTAFLGGVIRAATGAEGARAELLAEIENAQLITLPPEIKLRPSADSYQRQLVVQPDALLTTASSYTLIEAKRIRQGSFQEEQLAREFVATTREAAGRTPLLLVVIPSPPPVRVAKLGRLDIEEAVAARLDPVFAQTEGHPISKPKLRASVAETVAWITWDQVREVVIESRGGFDSGHPSVQGTINRLADFVTEAIRRHS